MSVAVASTVRYSHAIGQLSQSGAGFNNPIDVEAAGGGKLYVLSRSNMAHAEMGFLRVGICTIDEEYIGQFSGYGYDDGMMVWPTAIAVNRTSGHVYVSDQQRHDAHASPARGQREQEARRGEQTAGEQRPPRGDGRRLDPAAHAHLEQRDGERVQHHDHRGE